MGKVSISVQKLRNKLKNILDLKISNSWKGYGSALFIELGDLHEELAWKKDGKPQVAQVGEWTLSSAGAWKLFRGKELLLDAEKAKQSDIEKIVKAFLELTVKSVDFKDSLRLHLSDNKILELNKADYGFFNLILNEKTNIGYEDDKPYIEHIIL